MKEDLVLPSYCVIYHRQQTIKKNHKQHTRTNHIHMHIKMKYRAGQIFIKGDIFFWRSQEKEQANNFPINSKWCFTTTALDYFSSFKFLKHNDSCYFSNCNFSPPFATPLTAYLQFHLQLISKNLNLLWKNLSSASLLNTVKEETKKITSKLVINNYTSSLTHAQAQRTENIRKHYQNTILPVL